MDTSIPLLTEPNGWISSAIYTAAEAPCRISKNLALLISSNQAFLPSSNRTTYLVAASFCSSTVARIHPPFPSQPALVQESGQRWNTGLAPPQAGPRALHT